MHLHLLNLTLVYMSGPNLRMHLHLVYVYHTSSGHGCTIYLRVSRLSHVFCSVFKFFKVARVTNLVSISLTRWIEDAV